MSAALWRVGVLRRAGVLALLASGALAAAAAAAAAAGAAAAGEGEEPLAARQLEGQRLYQASCSYCHAPGGWGARDLARRLGAERAVLLERTDLDPLYIRSVVRHGLNSMPAYTPTDLTERQIAYIADYLTRANPAPITRSR
jgi:mono/diheme cytochrome c family protein